jgi:hypothetical protein
VSIPRSITLIVEIIGREGLKEILNSIYKKINTNYYGYINNEDERMISAVKEILERDIIPVGEIEEWIRSFGNIEKIVKEVLKKTSRFGED